jgi:hypothetical protein
VKIMDEVAHGKDLDEIRRFVVGELIQGRDHNEAELKRRARWYQAGIVLLILEVVTLVIGLLLS